MLIKGIIVYPITYLLSFGPIEIIRILKIFVDIKDYNLDADSYFFLPVLFYLNGFMNSITFFILRYQYNQISVNNNSESNEDEAINESILSKNIEE